MLLSWTSKPTASQFRDCCLAMVDEIFTGRFVETSTRRNLVSDRATHETRDRDSLGHEFHCSRQFKVVKLILLFQHWENEKYELKYITIHERKIVTGKRWTLINKMTNDTVSFLFFSFCYCQIHLRINFQFQDEIEIQLGCEILSI